MPHGERKLALVTGSSRGIGKECSIALGLIGYDVIITARKSSEVNHSFQGSLAETAREIEKNGTNAYVVEMDLLNTKECVTLVKAKLNQLGNRSINVLVNCGIYQGIGNDQEVVDLELEELEKLLVGNLITQFALVKLVLPPMLQRNEGFIFQIVSSSSTMTPTRSVKDGGWSFGYVAAKASVGKLIPLLAIENSTKSNVFFYNIEPGLVVTEKMKSDGKADLFRKWGDIPPQVPARVITHLVTNPEKKFNGKEIYSPKFAHDLQLNIPGFQYDHKVADGVEKNRAVKKSSSNL